MKTLKFRVWKKHIKEMVNDVRAFYVDDLNKNGFITMQYIGFKDKHGTEIYEGDVVDWWSCEYLGRENHEDHDSAQYDKHGKVISKGCQPECGVVVYDENHACYCVQEPGDDYKFTIPYNRPLQVLGNIYENPDLN